jgi:hypothetical protein
MGNVVVVGLMYFLPVHIVVDILNMINEVINMLELSPVLLGIQILSKYSNSYKVETYDGIFGLILDKNIRVDLSNEDREKLINSGWYDELNGYPFYENGSNNWAIKTYKYNI